MEHLILKILQKSDLPLTLVITNIGEFIKAMEVTTSERIYFKNAVFSYFTERGHYREKKLLNTYEIWVKQDVNFLQENDLLKLKERLG